MSAQQFDASELAMRRAGQTLLRNDVIRCPIKRDRTRVIFEGALQARSFPTYAAAYQHLFSLVDGRAKPESAS
jgi:hypothetical protein